MDLNFCITRLSQNAEKIQAIVRAVTGEQVRWKLDPDSWFVLEVVNVEYAGEW